jgi:hypothetical protein
MEDRECPSNFEVTHSLSESFSHAKYLCLAQNWDAPWVKPLPGLPGFPLDELLADQLPIARLGKNSGILVRDPRDSLWGLAVLARSALG